MQTKHLPFRRTDWYSLGPFTPSLHVHYSFECWSALKAALRPGCEHGQLLQPPLSLCIARTAQRGVVQMRANVEEHTWLSNLCYSAVSSDSYINPMLEFRCHTADQEMHAFLKSVLDYRLAFYSRLFKAVADWHRVNVHTLEIKWNICTNSTVDISLIKAKSYHRSLFSWRFICPQRTWRYRHRLFAYKA